MTYKRQLPKAYISLFGPNQNYINHGLFVKKGEKVRNKLKIVGGIMQNWLGSPTPVYCQWDVTHICNMRCSFCNVVKKKSVWQPELNTEQALKLIDQLAGLGVVILNISGGEPLLRTDLGILLSKAKKKGINTFVATNGWFLKEKADLLKDAYAIRVSIDGIGEFHDRFRIKGAYNRAVEGLEELLRRKKRVAINSVISSKTPYEQLVGLCELARSHSIQISFSPAGISLAATKNPTKKDMDKEVMALMLKEEWFFQAMDRLRKRYGSLIADPALYYRLIKQDGLDKFGCKAVRIAIDIKPDGSLVMPCGAWPVESAKGNLRSIWKSSQVREMRKKVGKYPFCKNCNIKCMMFPSMLLNARSMIELALSYKV
jgi:MoaA/NifB/PqqE/SkfB family radical SAM enzyme